MTPWLWFCALVFLGLAFVVPSWLLASLAELAANRARYRGLGWARVALFAQAVLTMAVALTGAAVCAWLALRGPALLATLGL